MSVLSHPVQSPPASSPAVRPTPPAAARDYSRLWEPSLARRFWSHPRATQYHRLFAALILANAFMLVRGLAVEGWARDSLSVPLEALGNLALANFSIAILIRQQRVINALFWLATRVPLSAPLWLRWQCGKVFHFGGLHTAGATSGTVWFALLLGGQAWHAAKGGDAVSLRTLCLSGAVLPLLFTMILTALPPMRSKNHNRFERMHRFMGWTVLALFWMHTLSTQADLARGHGFPLFRTPQFWVLCVLTLSVASTWWRLKIVPVEAVRTSSHAVILRFGKGCKAFPGSAVAISHTPLLEWHSFATIPAPGEDGFRLIVSRAGDWTGALIENPPSRVWIKGIATAGVANIEVLFKRVVYVATGSGIGPCMTHLLHKRLPIFLIWATKNPIKTYGQPLVDEILRAVPDAVIWDTDTHGKPNLSAMALDAVSKFRAEAVIVIANRRLTENVIQASELNGIPAYGAIFDS
ncbi:MAG: hypothetical protein ABIW76_22985 [Fibrobacteria bacterium]